MAGRSGLRPKPAHFAGLARLVLARALRPLVPDFVRLSTPAGGVQGEPVVYPLVIVVRVQHCDRRAKLGCRARIGQYRGCRQANGGRRRAGQNALQPRRCRSGHIPLQEVCLVAPGVLAPARVQARLGHDVSAGLHVDALPQRAHAVRHLVGGERHEDMLAAAAGLGNRRVGDRTVFGLDRLPGDMAAVARVDVNRNGAVLAHHDADVGVWHLPPPVFDACRVGAGVVPAARHELRVGVLSCVATGGIPAGAVRPDRPPQWQHAEASLGIP